MQDSALQSVGKYARHFVAFAAAAILVFSFAWVFIARPLRTAGLKEGQIRLSVVHWGEKNEDQIVAQLVREFEAQPENHDIRIQRINLGQAAAVNTKLQTMFAAGEPPDLFYLGYEKVGDFGSKHLLADIGRLIEEDKAANRPTVNLDEYFQNVLNCFRFNDETQRTGSGRLVALPKDFTTAGFYYNKDLLKRAGVPEPSPDGWTWEEFIDAARKIGKLPNCYGADFVTWEAMVRLYIWNHGVDFLSDDWKTYRFDDPELERALSKLQGWFHQENRTLVSAKTQMETGLEPFLTGNVGFAGPFGRWKLPTFRLISNFDWDLAPLPHASGVKPRNGIFTAAWAIAETSPHREKAWRFIKFMNSRHGQEMMSSAGLAISVLKDVAKDEALSRAELKPRHRRVFLDAAEYAEPIDWPSDPAYIARLRVQMEKIFKQNEPIPAVLKAAERDWLEIDRKNANVGSYSFVNWLKVTAWIVSPLAALIVIGLAIWWMRRPRGLEFRDELAGSAMVSPWVIGFVAFTAFPVVMSLLLAFMHWSGMSTLDQAQWVGVDNFRSMFQFDATFKRALWVTAFYALLAVPTGQLAALAAAMLMNHEWKSIGIFRAIWYLPSVLAGVGMAVMWKLVFHHEHGLLNSVLAGILPPDGFLAGLLPADATAPAWFEKDAERWGVPAFAIVNLWSIGGTMMIYLAGLKGISKDLYEAASIDGATGFRRFLHVTLPMLSPVIFFNVIIAIIASFQVFTQAFIMTGGGPGDATKFYVIYLYSRAFDLHDMGYASAMAWILLLIVLALTLLVMKGSKRFVYYEALKT